MHQAMYESTYTAGICDNRHQPVNDQHYNTKLYCLLAVNNDYMNLFSQAQQRSNQLQAQEDWK